MNIFESKSDTNDEIDFENEIAEFITENLIKKYDVIEKGLGHAILLMTTLENLKIKVMCSTTKGIEVMIANQF